MPHTRQIETKETQLAVRFTRRVVKRLGRAASVAGLTPTEFIRLATLRAVEDAERNGNAGGGGGRNGQ
jgi:hypothetical protein